MRLARNMSWAAFRRILERSGLETGALVLGLLLALETAARIAPTGDEPKHVMNGLSYLRTGRCCITDESPVAGLHAWWVSHYGGLRISPGNPAGIYDDQRATFASFVFSTRVPTCLAFALLILIVWRWSRRLFPAGSSWVPVLLCATCPTLLAHGSVATEDMFLTTAVAFAFYRLFRYLENPTRRGAVVVGAAMGIVYLTKASAPIAHLALLAAWLLGLRLGATRVRLQRREWALDAASMLVIPLIVLNAGYLFDGTGHTLRDFHPGSHTMAALASSPLGAIPLPFPRGFIHSIDFLQVEIMNRQKAGNDYFLFGETYRTGHRYYFIVAFLVKTTTITLVLGGIGIVTWWRSHRREPAHVALWLFPAMFLVFNLAMNPVHIGVRYVLPIYPFFILATGFARRRVEARAWWRLASAVPVVIALVQFPNYLGYFNASSVFRARERMLVDSNLDWGQFNYLVAQDAVGNPNARGWLAGPAPHNDSRWSGAPLGVGTFYISPSMRPWHRALWVDFLRDPEPSRQIGGTIGVYEITSEDQFAVQFVDDWRVSASFAAQPYRTTDGPDVEPLPPKREQMVAKMEATTTALLRTSFGFLGRGAPSSSCFVAQPEKPLQGEILYSADDVAYVYDESLNLVDTDATPSPTILPERTFIAERPQRFVFLVCNITGNTGLEVATRAPEP